MPIARRAVFTSATLRWSALALATALIPGSALAQKRHAETGASSRYTPQTPSFYGPQPDRENLDLATYARIRTEAFEHGHAMQFAEALMDGIGPRLTGSPNMARANAWTRDTLAAIGLSNAHLEDWGEFGRGWQQINTWGRLLGPDPEPLWLEAAPWSVSTNGTITAQVVYIPLDEQADLEKAKGTLKGKIVLLGTMRRTADLGRPLFSRYSDAELKAMESAEELETENSGEPRRDLKQYLAERKRLHDLRQAFVKQATEEGAAAIITPSRESGNHGGTGIIFDDNGADLVRSAEKPENATKVPVAVMMVEHYNRLARMVSAKVPVSVELNIATKFTGDHEHGFNTVAEIPGTDPRLKDEVVMVGGHLDSWISGTGATDNGAGSVMAIEAMRILKALDVHPRRTVRIALWSGEEQGLYGSLGYARQHFGTFAAANPPDAASVPAFMARHGAFTPTGEWEKLDAYYNLDNGTGKVRGVYTQGNFAAGSIFRQWIAPLADLGVSTITNRNTGGTDHLSFDAMGLPGFQFIQDPMDYDTRTHHSNMDTLDRLHSFDLEQGAALEAIFLYNTSQRDEMMPRKPFPHPELETRGKEPIPNIYPHAQVPPPDVEKPAAHAGAGKP